MEMGRGSPNTASVASTRAFRQQQAAEMLEAARAGRNITGNAGSAASFGGRGMGIGIGQEDELFGGMNEKFGAHTALMDMLLKMGRGSYPPAQGSEPNADIPTNSDTPNPGTRSGAKGKRRVGRKRSTPVEADVPSESGTL